MKAVKVVKKEAEKIKKKLIQLGLLDSGYFVGKDKGNLYFPLKKVSDKIKNLDIVNKVFKPTKDKWFEEFLKKNFTKKELELIPRSLDIIGDIIILDIPDELKKKEKKVAEYFLKSMKNINVVTKKVGIHHGEFRTQDLKVLAGEKRKETICKENNARLKLNVETSYFSPRLSTERQRIYELVKPNEKILVMFSGIAPYPVVISKNTEASKIIGIELNPEAHKYGLENVKLNKISNVELINGDVNKVVPKLKEKFDRIIMPLPKSAEDFLKSALKVSKKGTVIHFYAFADEKDIPDVVVKKIKKYVPKAKILRTVKCGQYSPRKFRVSVDFKV